MTNSFLILGISILFIFLIPFVTLWIVRKKNYVNNTYTRAKRILLIYVSILLLSMVVDEVFLKNKREVLVEGNVKESFETVDKIYMGNTKAIKSKYIHGEWVFPYTNQKLLINEFNSLPIVIERVENVEKIKATMYYDQIIDDYEMRYSEPFIDLDIVNEELFVTSKAVEKVYNKAMDTSFLNNFPMQKERSAHMWGGSNSFAILYMQIPEDLIIETSDDVWIEYIRK